MIVESNGMYDGVGTGPILVGGICSSCQLLDDFWVVLVLHGLNQVCLSALIHNLECVVWCLWEWCSEETLGGCCIIVRIDTFRSDSGL